MLNHIPIATLTFRLLGTIRSGILFTMVSLKTGGTIEIGIPVMTKLADKVRLLNESGLFAEEWYVERYPDVLRCGMSPAEHYVRIGQYIGRKPSREQDGAAVSRFLASSPTSEATDEDVFSGIEPNSPRLHSPMSTAAVSRKVQSTTSTSGLASSSALPLLPDRPAHPVQNASGTGAPYKQYEKQIFAKLDQLANREPLSVDVEIDTDYTGPVHGTPFESFLSPRQRDDSIKHTVRMLQLGIVGVNPRPGVHAARDENGDFIRYRSILAQDEVVERLPSSMLVHIHAFYPDVVEEMLECFVGKAQHGRFLVTTTTRKNHEAVSRILDEREFSGAETILIENKGRDIGPFLDYVLDYASKGDVICHVHTKKSPDVGGTYGEKWRKLLYGALLTQTAVDAFNDEALGLLFPDTSRSVGWGKNVPFCESIAKNLGSTLRSHPGPMPVGNMFFARFETAQAMREATKNMEWPREPVPYDGTVLHAIERMWTVACERANLQWAAIYARHDEKKATAKGVKSARTARVKR